MRAGSNKKMSLPEIIIRVIGPVRGIIRTIKPPRVILSPTKQADGIDLGNDSAESGIDHSSLDCISYVLHWSRSTTLLDEPYSHTQCLGGSGGFRIAVRGNINQFWAVTFFCINFPMATLIIIISSYMITHHKIVLRRFRLSQWN